MLSSLELCARLHKAGIRQGAFSRKRLVPAASYLHMLRDIHGVVHLLHAIALVDWSEKTDVSSEFQRTFNYPVLKQKLTKVSEFL
jgi:hypothetical protein